MIFLRLFFEFFKVGLFSIGGGLATIPFLSRLGDNSGWFSQAQLADLIAVSESTPGPIGVNMASYVGYITAGPPGCVVATLGLIAPSILVILIIAQFLKAFRQSRAVDAVFYGLRPASTALIAAAGAAVARIALFSPAGARGPFPAVRWEAAALFLLVFALLQWSPLKKLHPVVFIVLSAGAGLLFQL